MRAILRKSSAETDGLSPNSDNRLQQPLNKPKTNQGGCPLNVVGNGVEA